jgi:hypothetical protein
VENSNQADFDDDGVGDACDPNADNDPLADVFDAFTFDNHEWLDLDNDNVADNVDPDTDNDGVSNAADNCPFLSNADQADINNNGVGDACDPVQPANAAPVLDPLSNQVVNRGGTATFTAVATDANTNDTLHFSLVGEPAGASINQTSGSFQWTPTAQQQGPFPFFVCVSDSKSNDCQPITITVGVDTTPPTITAAATTAPNANGWYNTNVTVHFTCDDGNGSGIPAGACPPDQILNTEGTAVSSAAQTVTDAAGNTSAPSNIVTVKIDKTPPSLNPTISAGTILLNGTATVMANATDTLSGIESQSCAPLVTNSVGPKSITCTAIDKAGNSNSAFLSYRVIYRFDGFLQPINDTAHTTYCGTPCVASIFRGGSTVPVKFQLKDANGNIVQAASLPLWVTPQRGNPTTLSVDEGAYSGASTNGQYYRWDATTQQYVYNWNTKGFATGYFWRIGVTLDDGQTYYVNIGLR